MTNNPLSGHTAGTNDGLRDGDHILSPSLTNLYEGVHGNGILLPHDTAYSDSDRNDPADLPGAISAGSAANQFVVKSCDVILDGVLYAVGGGSDTTITLTSTTSQKLGTFTALSSGKECIFVVVATPEGIKVTQTTPITTASGAYASISGTAASYLTTGVGSGENRQSVVLGTVRATNSGGSTVGDLAIQSLSEYNDKRVFVRPTPLFLSPVRDGSISSTSGISDHTALSQVHGTNQHGTYGDVGVIWQSFNDANESMLYYSRKDGSNRHTHLLGPTNISVASPAAGTTNFKYDDDQVFILTPTGARNLTPSGTFPPGHTVFVSVPSGSTVTFTGTSPNTSITAGDAIMFAYDGTNWRTVLYSSTVSTVSSGSSGVVQLSDGAGGFTSDSTLSYDTAANELTVDGKLTVTGLIDPTGLELTPQTSNPAAADAGVVDANTLWLDDNDSDRLKHGALSVMRENDDISELNNDAGFTTFAAADAVTAVGNAVTGIVKADGAGSLSAASAGTDYQGVLSEGAFVNGDKTKLDGIATSATNTAPPAIEDNSGTPAFATGITKAEVQSLLNVADGAVANVVEDTTPQLGGNLDANGNNIDFDDATGIRDSNGNEQLIFQETASAVNHLEATNAASTNNPQIAAVGDDANIGLTIKTKGTGDLLLDTDVVFFNKAQIGYGSGPAKLQVYNAGDNMEIYAAGDSGGNVKILDLDAGTDGAEANRIATVTGQLVVSQTLQAPRLPTVSLSSNTTLSEASHAGRYIFVTGSSTVITIPDNQAAGVHFTLLSNSSNSFTLRTGTSGSTGDNMNGSQADITVDARNGVTCISTGTDYVVLGA